MEGVSSEMIIERMANAKGKVMSKEAMVEWMKINSPELIIMAGAGDIDVEVNKVVKVLEAM